MNTVIHLNDMILLKHSHRSEFITSDVFVSYREYTYWDTAETLSGCCRFCELLSAWCICPSCGILRFLQYTTTPTPTTHKMSTTTPSIVPIKLVELSETEKECSLNFLQTKLPQLQWQTVLHQMFVCDMY